MAQFVGKVALVTGAGAGIGRASAIAFAREGARVAVVDVRPAGGLATVDLIANEGGEATFIEADVAKSPEVEAMVARTVEAFGRLDFAHNNAGVVTRNQAPIAEYDEDEWDRIIAINLKGIWLGMKYELGQMLKQGGGAIVNTASAAGLVATPNRSAYNASKHGVIGITKTAALEYAQSGIRVNAVCPGAIRTQVLQRSIERFPDLEPRIAGDHPMGRIGESSEVAAAVIWLCSDASSYVTGHALSVDGGYVAR